MAWIERLVSLTRGGSAQDIVLETISISHFVEKVRWCMDRLGVPYEERRHAGTLGAFTLGRTVPRLHFRTGAVTSNIGNSSEILRYLWGRYGLVQGEQAEFLKPTAAAIAWETRCDRYGADLQRWVYGHVLGSPRFTLRAWGVKDPRVPLYQRVLIVLCYPLLVLLMRRAFHITAESRVKSHNRIQDHLANVEAQLQETPFLAGSDLSFADLTLASLSGVWLFPREYGNGLCSEVIPSSELIPKAMAQEIQSWRDRFPITVSHVERLYREERAKTQTK